MVSSESDLAAVVLAAGAGTRLRPLTDHCPKALCPVNNVPLLDWAVARVQSVAYDIAVNAHHHADLIAAHVGKSGLHLSVEQPEALGTAGALAQLKPWIDGRAVLAANADAWGPTDLTPLTTGWDGATPRLLVKDDPGHPDFEGRYRYAGACLLPWSAVEPLQPTPSGLYEVVWQRQQIELVPTAEPFFDCGTPGEYLDANLAASGGQSVIGPGADVHGDVVRSVVWPGAYVGPDERLVECIRLGRDVTVGRNGLWPRPSET